MAKEHWNHLAFVTFLYFIYLIILIETIGIGKKNFEIYQNESFFIIIFLTIISSVINEYLQLKTHEKAIILTFIMGILILSFVQDVKLNQTYSITLMLIGLLTLIYIAYLPISLIKPNSQRSTVKKDNLDKHFLIDIYFNRTFLYYPNTHLEPSKNMRKEIFYALIGFLFSLSLPIIINEVKTPTVVIEKYNKEIKINE